MANPNGRPPKFNSPKALQAAVDAYFVACDNKIITKQVVTGGKIIHVETPTPYTVAGLASHLGVTRTMIFTWETEPPKLRGSGRAREQFSNIITRSKVKIEADNIAKGMTGVYEARINALNLAANFGYAAKQEVSVDAKGNLASLVAASEARLRGESNE